MISNKVNLKSIIGPAFYDVHKHIKNNDFTHYWLKGGRGSLKSSCIGTEIPLGIMRDAKKGLMNQTCKRYFERFSLRANQMGHLYVES